MRPPGLSCLAHLCHFFFQAEDGIRYLTVTGVQTCALPICAVGRKPGGIVALRAPPARVEGRLAVRDPEESERAVLGGRQGSRIEVGRAEENAGLGDRKSTRLNSSHSQISYAVFCLKKQKTKNCLNPSAHGKITCLSTSQPSIRCLPAYI